MIEVTISPNSILIVDDVECVNRSTEPQTFTVDKPKNHARFGVIGSGTAVLTAVLTVDNLIDDKIAQFSTTAWWLDDTFNGSDCLSFFK